MRKGIVTAIITFFIAFAMGLFVNPDWGISLVRAVISALIVLAGSSIIMFIVQRFLPELLMMPEKTVGEDKTFGGSLHRDVLDTPSLEGSESYDNDLGRTVDIVLDEKGPMQNYGSSLSEAGSPNQFSTANFPRVGSSDSSFVSELDHKREVFAREDPSILAKMVRTRLSDED